MVTFLGSGTYGEVWKGKEKSRKREVAVKIETEIVSYSELYFSIFILTLYILGLELSSTWKESLQGSSKWNWNPKNYLF